MFTFVNTFRDLSDEELKSVIERFERTIRQQIAQLEDYESLYDAQREARRRGMHNATPFAA